MNNGVVIISGLSGSGKTTVGKYYADRHGYIFLDGDEFFKRDKPQIVLIDDDRNYTCSNWDTPDAIDWKLMNRVILDILKSNKKNLLLVTFLPIMMYFEFQVIKHIRLELGPNMIEKCIEARKTSKHLNGNALKMRKDELMVRQVVVPLYEQISLYPVDNIICVYESENRKSVEQIADEIAKII